MASCVAELDSTLTSMLELKPPGVSGAKIQSLQALCNSNVQSESVLIQKIYAHFKKAPGNKKLGVLYVVDSVTRQWLEQARKAGQTLGSSASDGTYAAGVNHVTELLPALMQDIISVAPEDQKAKIKKLIEIWERGNTFPANMLNGFKERLNAPSAVQSTTPTGTPPQDFSAMAGNAKPGAAAAAAPTQDTSSILANLERLATLSKNNSAGPMGAPNQSANPNNVSFPQAQAAAAFPQNVQPAVNPVSSMQPAPQTVSAPTPVNNGVYSYGGGSFPQNLFPGGQAQAAQALQQQSMPQNSTGGGAAPDALQQQLQILQALKVQGIPEAQWPSLLAVLMASTNPAAAAANQAQPTNVGGGGGRDDASRDHRNGYDQYVRSPPGGGRYGNRDRSRSRSPRGGWNRRRDDSPRRGRRDSPVYGEYGGNRDRGDDRDRDYGRRGGRGSDRDNRGGRSNRRSPDRFRRSPSPRRNHELPAPGPKWVEFESNLPKGTIKVYSRTLFVGGVTTSEETLRSIFSAFGLVQTCIVNIEKRHAFVKMISRKEAVQAKDGMEHYKTGEMQLRTRWGVGFGPRDCSDYQTGISIIPIDRLTDADRKWMVSAEYGGSGGKPIQEGMCVEEPDIEIGAGVSSKGKLHQSKIKNQGSSSSPAISRRMQTDKSGASGPRSSRDPPQNQRYRQPDRRENHERENSNSNIQVPPAVPGFGFQLPLMGGAGNFPFSMPPGVQFPPGFVIPGQNQSQPPPPGAT